MIGPTVAALGQELVELGAILGEAQPLEEFLELALLLFEPPQRLGPVFIESAIAAGRRAAPPPLAIAAALRLPAGGTLCRRKARAGR